MSTRIFQVDSFTDVAFRGNPAGVCLLETEADAKWMQQVAAEMNLSETAFLVHRLDGDFDLRWFTPAVEIDLCGHATLATAHILWETGMVPPHCQARFHTASGLLTADHIGHRIELDLPVYPPAPVDAPDEFLDTFGLAATYVGLTRSSYLVEVSDPEAVLCAAPDGRLLHRLNVRGVMVTALSADNAFDFVSRVFFVSKARIDEDPVTGSAYCALAPHWSERLARNEIVGYQASARGGTVHCRMVGNRVRVSGHAITILSGQLVAR